MCDTTGQIYLGTILLEKNRWPDSPATRFGLAERLCRGRAALPSVRVSDWAERARAVGGHCHVESRPGQGTRVVVEVPR